MTLSSLCRIVSEIGCCSGSVQFVVTHWHAMCRPRCPNSARFFLTLAVVDHCPSCCETSACSVQAKQVQELQRQAQDGEVEIKELKQAATKRQQAGAAVNRAFKSQKANLDALSTRRADLLSTAAMEQVSLTPLKVPGSVGHVPLSCT